ncbi:hypothetical protein [Salinibacterium sp. ZJ70]|uniref:hypothetical protein n=1 Tax=Salinibacterium sp. ZJ70 TaxID=2708084 RepID=UPI00141F2E19|nr:hypothetical protein [Salinibacterium sp. ZJ70]
MRAAIVEALCAAMIAALLSACTPGGLYGPVGDPYPEGAVATIPAAHPQAQLRCPLEAAFLYDPQELPLDEIDAAYICTATPWSPDPQGRPRTMQHIDGVPLTALPHLLETFLAPDAAAARPCDEDSPEPLIVWLHHEGGITPVRAPADTCRRPLTAAAAAFDHLPRTRLASASETEGLTD